MASSRSLQDRNKAPYPMCVCQDRAFAAGLWAHSTQARPGAKQYQLCGEFLPTQREGKAEWTPFATIKTSGFEKHLGVQAASWCQRSQFVQDGERRFVVKIAELT